MGNGSGDGGVGPMGRWGHTATMISESTMMVLGGQADDDAHQATLGDLYKFDFGGWLCCFFGVLGYGGGGGGGREERSLEHAVCCRKASILVCMLVTKGDI